ncbi:hypothetical protein [Ancylothrix sp. D3o]|uniref:hypothetical protein n=1 Tax=Ancylothrix sp. D3o TaxID=2953691 RepID=UPI0021BA99AF|nr:hypothetical protein [Ancylothrix sp. D3o]
MFSISLKGFSAKLTASLPYFFEMFDFNFLFEFSRAHCIAICAFLVPANLVCTLLTMILTALHRPAVQVRFSAAFASVPALVMVLHVFTWFMVGVVMLPTFILLTLATVCLAMNFWAVVHPQSMARLLRWLFMWVRGRLPFGVATEG